MYLNKQMNYRNSSKINNSHHSQYQAFHEGSSTTFLKRLQQNLQDVSEQVQISNNKINQLTKLLEIMTEQRNYYHDQLKKSEQLKQKFQNQLRKQRVQLDSKQVLINQLKKANRHLTQQVQTLNENLQQTKFLFQAQQQQIDRIRKQKQLIQSQWNRVIKQVNTKIYKIQKKQQQEQKQNNQFLANLPLKQKVKKALKKIDREIKEQELNSRDRFNYSNNELKQSPISSTSGNQFLDLDDSSNHSYTYV